MRWYPHVTVAAIVERDGRFLFVEEDKGHGPVLNQPAGHLEDDETIPAALEREVLEETGWTVAAQALVGIYRWRNPGNGETFLRFCLACTPLAHDAQRRLDDGILRALWLSPDELGAYRLRSPLVRPCLDDWLAGERLPLTLLRTIV